MAAKRWFLVALVTLPLVMHARPGQACTSANCTLFTRTDVPQLRRGAWRVDFGWRFVNQDARRYEDGELAVTDGALQGVITVDLRSVSPGRQFY